MSFDHHLYIAGLGLIGGSVAHGLADSEIAVSGWDQDPDTRSRAGEAGIVRDIFPPTDLPASVDGVLLAVPVPKMVSVLKKIVSNRPGFDYVTDVGSTKNWICKKAVELLPEDIDFIGAHPMAGSEKNGLVAADPLLFENALCVLTPVEPGNKSLDRVRTLWQNLGAHIIEMGPAKHDKVAAHISHLPHLAAAGLIHAVEEVPRYREHVLPLAAGGFRDTTRIAGSEPDLWRDIVSTNREEILTSIEEFKLIFDKLEKLLKEKQWSTLTEWLAEARELRNQIPEKAKGLLGTLYELRIQAPDSPGILAEITGILGEASINICDIEVVRVREGEKGTIRLAFRNRDELKEAQKLLRENAEGISII